METNQNQTPVPGPAMSQDPSFVKTSEDRQMLLEIYENTRKTKRYMQWQMYITIVLIVLPLLAMIALIPVAMKSLTTLGGIYGSGGLLQ